MQHQSMWVKRGEAVGIGILCGMILAPMVSAQTRMSEADWESERRVGYEAVRAEKPLSGIDPRELDAAISGTKLRSLVSPRTVAQAPAQSQPLSLVGEAMEACQAMLCLAAVGEAPAQCQQALAKYYAMQSFMGMGGAFLALCPTK